MNFIPYSKFTSCDLTIIRSNFVRNNRFNGALCVKSNKTPLLDEGLR